MAMQHKRQAPGRDIHKHFSLAPARSHTITASSKASATATRNPPPHPGPYKTGPKLAKRRRGHHTCHSSLSLPPSHPRSPAAAYTPPHLKPRMCTNGEGRRNSARLCITVVRRTCSPPLNHSLATGGAISRQGGVDEPGAGVGRKGHPLFQPRHHPTRSPPACCALRVAGSPAAGTCFRLQSSVLRGKKAATLRLACVLRRVVMLDAPLLRDYRRG